MTNIEIKKLYDDVEIPKGINGIIDLRIHSFHKITEYDGIVPHSTETYLMQGCTRVLVKMGYSLRLCKHYSQLDCPPYQFQIISRRECAILHGLVVLNTPCFWSGQTNDELEVILYCSSYDRVILLRKGFRIAQAMLVPIEKMNIIESNP